MQLNWEEKLVTTILQNPELQTWNSHLNIRIPELRSIGKAIYLRKNESILEVGCGNGLASAYFSNQVGHVVASDLPDVDHSAHSIGLTKAKLLMKTLNIKNVDVVGCSADALPFEPSRFDLVLSIFTFEHIAKREQALRDAYRVLKPGGRLIITVPTSMLALFYPISFYIELFERVLKRFLFSSKSQNINHSSIYVSTQEPEKKVIKDWKSFRKVYPHFPIPKPHGEYMSWFEEIAFQRPSNWRQLVSSAGFNQIEIKSLSMIPSFIPHLTLKFLGEKPYVFLQKIDGFLCGLGFMKKVAQTICIIGTKNG